MKRYWRSLSVGCLLVVLGCCTGIVIPVGTAEDYVLHIGQDKTITEFNNFNRLYGDYTDPNVHYPMPSDWDAVRDGNTVNTWFITNKKEGGYALGGLQALITIDYGSYTPEEVRDLPVRVIYDLSYNLDVDWGAKVENASAHAMVYAPPFLEPHGSLIRDKDVINAAGPTATQDRGSIVWSGKYPITTLGGTPLTIGNFPNYLALNVQSDSVDHANDFSCTARADATINSISIEFPLAAIIHADKASGFAPLTVQFTDASFGNPNSWSWDFNDTASGDRNYAKIQNPSHEFDFPGTYTVKLTVTDTQGNSDTCYKVITVLGNEQAIPIDIPEVKKDPPEINPPKDDIEDKLREKYWEDKEFEEWYNEHFHRPYPGLVPPGFLPPGAFARFKPLVPIISHTIMPSDIQIYTVNIKPKLGNIMFHLGWPGSDLDLALYSPDGKRINTTNTINGDTFYGKNNTLNYSFYLVDHPQQGNWTIEIIPRDVAPEGENYTLSLLDLESNQTSTYTPTPSPTPTPASTPLSPIIALIGIGIALLIYGRNKRTF